MIGPDARRLWHAVWPGLVITAVGIAGYLVLLDWVTEQEWLWALDDPLVEWFAAHRTEGLTAFMEFVSWVFGAAALPILVAIGGAIWGWRTGQWFNAAVVVGSMALAGLLALALKLAVDRPRPPSEFWQEPDGVHTASFPSGHTLCAATLVLVTGFLAWRTERSVKVLVWWGVGSLALTALVAFSRLYLGYHFLTDVVAGFFAALMVLGVAVAVVRVWDARDDVAPGQTPSANAL